MPGVTLIKETGTGSTTANSYANATDGDSYHEGHLYATDWTGATTATKNDALVMASRLIDASYQFNGWMANETQALQWPRDKSQHPNQQSYFDDTEIPPKLLDAVCETARELIKKDPTDEPDGQGLKRLRMAGSVDLIFDNRDRKPMVPYLAQRFLTGLGFLIGENSNTAKLIRT
jgi:hypothetical protein